MLIAPEMNEHEPDLIDARSAMASLGVKAQTLYAYVSRGLVRAVKPHGRSVSLYYREDVEALQMRSRTRRAIDNVSQRALRTGGGAVMQTAITEFTPEGPRYRGRLATDLARDGQTFEECAEWIWGDLLSPATASAWDPPAKQSILLEHANVVASTAKFNSSRRTIALLVEAWASCLGPDPEMVVESSVLARDLLHVVAGAAGLMRSRPAFRPLRPGESMARGLDRHLSASPNEASEQALNAALVLCADHELAPATFVARIAASAGSDVPSCIIAALGAFEGMATGLGCDLAEQLLREAASPEAYVSALAGAARRQEPLPGFNHPLYPEGDPRALALIDMAAAAAKPGSPAASALRCIQAARKALGAEPSLPLGLCVLALAFGYPPRAPGAIMALSRCVGWIAHVYEQRTARFLVRPRAKYVGV